MDKEECMNIKATYFYKVLLGLFLVITMLNMNVYANYGLTLTSRISVDNELKIIIHEENNNAGEFDLMIINGNLEVKRLNNNNSNDILIISGAINQKTKINEVTMIKNLIKGYYSISIIDDKGNISHKLFQVL